VTLTSLIEALTLIAKSQPESTICAEHDQIWVGGVEGADQQDRDRLEKLGWFESEESWSHFV